MVRKPGGPWSRRQHAGPRRRGIPLPAMTRNPRGKKKIRGLTRIELTEALGVRLTTIDRMIAYGLRPIGHRGRAKLYRLADARRWAEQRAPVQIAAADVLITDYRSHAEDLRDRQQALVETWIADRDWRPLWQEAVAFVARVTGGWPTAIAERFVAMTPEERAHALWADEPRPAPPPPRRHLPAVEVLALLAGPEDRQPWRPAARPGIAALAARGVGVVVSDDGGWSPDTQPGALLALQAPRRVPDPWLRPVLAELSGAVSASTAFLGLEAALHAPALEPLPSAPQTVDEARQEWRRVRAGFRGVRVAVRRGHRRRTEIIERIAQAIGEFRARWWRARAELAAAAGDPAGASDLAERLRRETLDVLLTLDGWLTEPLPVPHDTTRTTPRAARRGTTTRRGR
jgi:hypothetical protein